MDSPARDRLEVREILEQSSIAPAVFSDLLEAGERGGVAVIAFGVGF